MTALQEAAADSAVCLEAVAKYEAGRLAASVPGSLPTGELDPTLWAALVAEANVAVAAKRPRWGEGRGEGRVTA
jgi:hypothetical protein